MTLREEAKNILNDEATVVDLSDFMDPLSPADRREILRGYVAHFDLLEACNDALDLLKGDVEDLTPMEHQVMQTLEAAIAAAESPSS